MYTHRKLKIIFSNYDSIGNPFYSGGGAYAIWELAKRLSPKYDVTIVAGAFPRSVNRTEEAVRFIYIGYPRFGSKLSQIVFQLLLPIFINRIESDVWFESFTPPLSTAFLPIFTRKKVVGLVHFLSGEEMLRKYKLPFFLIERFGLKTYKHFISLSSYWKSKIRNSNSKADIAIIPNGLDITLPKIENSSGKYILFIGRIDIKQKGLDILLAAFDKIKDKINYKLVIAGSGVKSEQDKLKQLISNLNLSRWVDCIGRVEKNEKIKAYRDSLFAVLPSRYETFSLSALEVMGLGLPLVIFDIPGTSWIPAECCVKVPAFDEDKLAEMMLVLTKNQKLREEKGRIAYQYSRKFSWEKIASLYDRYIQRLMKN